MPKTEKRLETCKFCENEICKISHMKTDNPHCNSCISYEEKQNCSVCKEAIDDGKEFHHKWDIGQVEEPICESCWNDETI